MIISLPSRFALQLRGGWLAVSVHASKAFSQWEAPWSCPCISDFKEAVQYGDNRAQPFFFFFPHWRHWISRAALLPGLSMKGVKPQSSLALWVLSVLGSSYLHLMCYRGKIKTSQWRGGGARGSCFPRDLSPWISPRLLSIDLLLWQLWQKEGQTLNSHKSAFLARSGNYWEQKSGSESLRTWCPLLMLPPCCSEALDPQGAVLLLLNLQKERKCTADPLSSSAPLVLFTLADIFQDV